MAVLIRIRVVTILLATSLAALLSLDAGSAFSIELNLQLTTPPLLDRAEASHPNQLPQSRTAKGTRNITSAWFANPTDRYRHGVLGDDLEASRLVVGTSDGKRLQVDLPISRVFEDLEPRLADIDEDGNDEIIVVESDTKLGASLALYSIVADHLERIAATSFLGTPYRWLNPVGVGDFDGDGRSDIALVSTPHIGGILRLYKFKGEKLILFAEYSNVSTHRIGSTELGLGRVVTATPRDRLLVPDQARRAIMLLEWTDNGWQEVARTELPDYLVSSLVPSGSDRWRFRLKNGNYYEIWMRQ